MSFDDTEPVGDGGAGVEGCCAFRRTVPDGLDSWAGIGVIGLGCLGSGLRAGSSNVGSGVTLGDGGPGGSRVGVRPILLGSGDTTSGTVRWMV